MNANGSEIKRFEAFRKLSGEEELSAFRERMEREGFTGFRHFLDDFKEAIRSFEDDDSAAMAALVERGKRLFPKPGMFSPSWQNVWEADSRLQGGGACPDSSEQPGWGMAGADGQSVHERRARLLSGAFVPGSVVFVRLFSQRSEEERIYPAAKNRGCADGLRRRAASVAGLAICLPGRMSETGACHALFPRRYFPGKRTTREFCGNFDNSVPLDFVPFRPVCRRFCAVHCGKACGCRLLRSCRLAKGEKCRFLRILGDAAGICLLACPDLSDMIYKIMWKNTAGLPGRMKRPRCRTIEEEWKRW